MNRSDWIGRALCCAATFGVAGLQVWLYTPENNLSSAAIQAVLSALTNTCAVLSAAAFVRGRISFELQRLGFCAVVIDCLNFAAFAAKSSPFVYFFNMTITVISCAQLTLLLWPRNGFDLHNFWRGAVFLVANFPVKILHLETKK